MKRFAFLLVFFSAMAHAQFDSLPDSPLDTSMGETEESSGARAGQISDKEFEMEMEQEEERQEELLENRYDVPDKNEEDELNLNGN